MYAAPIYPVTNSTQQPVTVYSSYPTTAGPSTSGVVIRGGYSGIPVPSSAAVYATSPVSSGGAGSPSAQGHTRSRSANRPLTADNGQLVPHPSRSIRSVSPSMRFVPYNMTREEYAQQLAEAKLRRHEVEFERALRVKQTELSNQQQRELKLQHEMQKENTAFERAINNTVSRACNQRQKNQTRKLIQQKNIEAKEHRQAIEHQQFEAAWNGWDCPEDQLVPYIGNGRSHALSVGSTFAPGTYNQRLKMLHLAEKKQRAQELNRQKQLKHEMAKRKEELDEFNRRQLLEMREARRQMIDQKIAQMKNDVMADRRDLDMAIYRLRKAN